MQKHEVIQHKLPAAEKYLSTLLHDVNIVRRRQQPVTLADTYLAQLRKLCRAIKTYHCSNPEDRILGDMSDVDVAVTS